METISRELCEINMKRIEEKVKGNTDEIAGLKKIYKSISDLTRAIDKLATETLHLREEQTELKNNIGALDNRIKNIEMKPASKWENMIWFIVTALVGAILALLFTKIGLK